MAVPSHPRTRLVSMSTLAVLPGPQTTKGASSEELGEQGPLEKKKKPKVFLLYCYLTCVWATKIGDTKPSQSSGPHPPAREKLGLLLQQLSQKEATESDTNYMWAAEAPSPSSLR